MPKYSRLQQKRQNKHGLKAAKTHNKLQQLGPKKSKNYLKSKENQFLQESVTEPDSIPDELLTIAKYDIQEIEIDTSLPTRATEYTAQSKKRRATYQSSTILKALLLMLILSGLTHLTYAKELNFTKRPREDKRNREKTKTNKAQEKLKYAKHTDTLVVNPDPYKMLMPNHPAQQCKIQDRVKFLSKIKNTKFGSKEKFGHKSQTIVGLAIENDDPEILKNVLTQNPALATAPTGLNNNQPLFYAAAEGTTKTLSVLNSLQLPSNDALIKGYYILNEDFFIKNPRQFPWYKKSNFLYNVEYTNNTFTFSDTKALDLACFTGHLPNIDYFHARIKNNIANSDLITSSTRCLIYAASTGADKIVVPHFHKTIPNFFDNEEIKKNLEHVYNKIYFLTPLDSQFFEIVSKYKLTANKNADEVIQLFSNILINGNFDLMELFLKYYPQIMQRNNFDLIKQLIISIKNDKQSTVTTTIKASRDQLSYAQTRAKILEEHTKKIFGKMRIVDFFLANGYQITECNEEGYDIVFLLVNSLRSHREPWDIFKNFVKDSFPDYIAKIILQRATQIGFLPYQTEECKERYKNYSEQQRLENLIFLYQISGTCALIYGLYNAVKYRKYLQKKLFCKRNTFNSAVATASEEKKATKNEVFLPIKNNKRNEDQTPATRQEPLSPKNPASKPSQESSENNLETKSFVRKNKPKNSKHTQKTAHEIKFEIEERQRKKQQEAEQIKEEKRRLQQKKKEESDKKAAAKAIKPSSVPLVSSKKKKHETTKEIVNEKTDPTLDTKNLDAKIQFHELALWHAEQLKKLLGTHSSFSWQNHFEFLYHLTKVYICIHEHLLKCKANVKSDFIEHSKIMRHALAHFSSEITPALLNKSKDHLLEQIVIDLSNLPQVSTPKPIFDDKNILKEKLGVEINPLNSIALNPIYLQFTTQLKSETNRTLPLKQGSKNAFFNYLNQIILPALKNLQLSPNAKMVLISYIGEYADRFICFSDKSSWHYKFLDLAKDIRNQLYHRAFDLDSKLRAIENLVKDNSEKIPDAQITENVFCIREKLFNKFSTENFSKDDKSQPKKIEQTEEKKKTPEDKNVSTKLSADAKPFIPSCLNAPAAQLSSAPLMGRTCSFFSPATVSSAPNSAQTNTNGLTTIP